MHVHGFLHSITMVTEHITVEEHNYASYFHHPQMVTASFLTSPAPPPDTITNEPTLSQWQPEWRIGQWRGRRGSQRTGVDDTKPAASSELSVRVNKCSWLTRVSEDTLKLARYQMIFLSGKNDVPGSISCCDWGIFEGDRRKMNRGKRKGEGWRRVCEAEGQSSGWKGGGISRNGESDFSIESFTWIEMTRIIPCKIHYLLHIFLYLLSPLMRLTVI